MVNIEKSIFITKFSWPIDYTGRRRIIMMPTTPTTEKLDTILEHRMNKLIESIKGRHYDDPMEERVYKRKIVFKMQRLLDGYKSWLWLSEDKD